MVVIVAGAMAFAIVQPIKVLPRLRPAPGYALTDEHGDRMTSEDARGVITLYTFMPLDCGADCDRVAETMASVRRRATAEVDLGGVPFQLVTIVLDPDVDPGELATLAASAGDTEIGGALDSTAGNPGAGEPIDDWHWLTGSATQLENIVGLGFRRSADPADFSPSFAIVDGWGTIRGEYRYSTLSGDTEKLLRHLDVLGGELRNRSGFATFAYDAAHAFQCYP